MVDDRKGISTVLTVTFIILGTIIGVALLWAFVVKSTNRSGEIVDPDCLTVNLELSNCKAYGACSYYFGNSYYEAEVIVKRNVGHGNVTGLRFIFENELGNKGTYDYDLDSTSRLGELQNLRIVDPYSIPVKAGSPNILRVAALIGKNKDVCPITSNSVKCPIVNSLPPLGRYANNTNPFSRVSSNRVGNCCQYPTNLSMCYVDPINLGNGFNLETGLYTGSIFTGKNKTVCCQTVPYSGNQVTFED